MKVYVAVNKYPLEGKPPSHTHYCPVGTFSDRETAIKVSNYGKAWDFELDEFSEEYNAGLKPYTVSCTGDVSSMDYVSKCVLGIQIDLELETYSWTGFAKDKEDAARIGREQMEKHKELIEKRIHG